MTTSVAVGERLERVLGLGDRVDPHGDALLEREPAVPGDVVGVGVRLQDGDDPHAVALGLHEVLLDRVRGVDDDRLACRGVTDQVGERSRDPRPRTA